MDFFFFGVGSVVERDAVEEGALPADDGDGGSTLIGGTVFCGFGAAAGAGAGATGALDFSSTAAGASYFARRASKSSDSLPAYFSSVASMESSLAGLCFS